MSAVTPLRGEVWGCALPQPVGSHPVVVLTVNRIAEPLSAITVVVVTGTPGPPTTHVAIGPECGVTTYPESYVNCTSLHTVDKPRLRKRLGRLSSSELKHVEENLSTILGLRH